MRRSSHAWQVPVFNTCTTVFLVLAVASGFGCRPDDSGTGAGGAAYDTGSAGSGGESGGASGGSAGGNATAGSAGGAHVGGQSGMASGGGGGSGGATGGSGSGGAATAGKGGSGGAAQTGGVTGAAGNTAGTNGQGSSLLSVGGGARRSFSTDGKTWTEAVDLQDAPDGDNQYLLSAACYGAGKWVTISHQGWIWTSVDGHTWQQQATLQGFSPTSCAYGNGVFVAGITSNEQITRGISTSSDGVSWKESNFNSTTRQVLFGNGIFVLTSNDGLFTSTNGTEWTPISSVSDGSDIAFGDGRFMVLTKGGDSVAESTDGKTWTTTMLKESGSGIAHGAGGFLVVSDLASFIRMDGQTNWVEVPIIQRPWSGAPSSMGGTDQVVVIAVSGEFYWTTNGRMWTASTIVGSSGRHFSTAIMASGPGAQ